MNLLTQQLHVGIDLSPLKARLLCLRGQRHPSIVAYSESNIPAGVIVDGQIIAANTLTNSIHSLHHPSHGRRFREKRVQISLPEQQCFTTTMPISGTTLAEATASALRYLPYPPDKMYYDVSVNKLYRTISVAAAKKELIEQYMHCVENAGWHVVGIYSEAEAAARALLLPTQKNNGVLLVDVGSARTTIVICLAGMVYFTTSYPTVETDGQLSNEHLLAALRQTCDYYQEHFHAIKPLSSIIICGGGAYAPELANTIGQALKLETILGQPLASLRQNRLSEKMEQPLRFTTAIGLALH